MTSSIMYQARAMCRSCKAIFDVLSDAKPDPKYEAWIIGYLCEKCSSQSTLGDLGFDV